MQLSCVCHNLKFMDLLQLARRKGITSARELSVLTGAGTQCGSCLPLLDELLKTGKVNIGGVEFPFPDPDRCDAEQTKAE